MFAYLPWLALWRADIITNGGWIVFIKFAALFAFLGPSLYVPRFFCRYFCPMGTLLDPVTSYKVRILHHILPLKEMELYVVRAECP